MSRAALQEIVRRQRIVGRVYSAFDGPALDFVRDRRRKVAAKCGRRGGKSHGQAGKYLVTAVGRPNETSVFIGLSAARADEVIGRAFRVLNRKLRLDLWNAAPKRTTRAGQLFYVFPNGHKVWVAGCKNRIDSEKFRGDPYCLVGVDECDSMRGHLQYLVQEVLEPTMLDFDGQLVLTGTPGVTPEGFFYNITTGNNTKQWPTHSWTVLENSHVPNAAEWLRIRREELGLDESSPAYRREWLGEWVLDLDSLCYQFDPEINTYDQEIVLAAGYHVVIGVDLGVEDATAIVAVAFQYGVPDIWTLESQSWPGLSPSAAYVRLRATMDRYPGARVVVDTGGMGRGFTREWEDTYGLSTERANKLDVRSQIAFMNGLLRAGTLHVHGRACRELIRQAVTVPWDDARKGHAPDYEDHELAAWRYAVLAVKPHYNAEREPPAPGSIEAIQAEQDAWKARQLARYTKKGWAT